MMCMEILVLGIRMEQKSHFWISLKLLVGGSQFKFPGGGVLGKPSVVRCCLLPH